MTDQPTPSPSTSFGRFAGLAVTMYLAAVASLLLRMFTDRELDDGAAWVIVVVILQVAWCACLGRPCATLSPARARALGTFTGALLSIVGLAGALCIGELADEGAVSLGFALGFVGTAMFVANRLTKRAARTSPAKASAMCLGTITPTAVVLGMLGGITLTSPTGDLLADLVAVVAMIACMLVVAFTVGPWLWLPFVRVRSPRVELPRAEVA